MRPFTWITSSRWLTLTVFVGSLHAAEPYRLAVPLGLDEFMPIPEDNPLTSEKVELGRRLFFDPRLSRDGTISCASCHVPLQIFTDGKAVGIGVAGRAGKRNVPSLFNRAYQRSFFWDGRETSLEAQVLRPIQDPKEMDLTLGELETRLSAMDVGGGPAANDSRGDEAVTPRRFTGGTPVPRGMGVPPMSEHFQTVFGEPPSAQNVAKALAAYIRVLISADSPFDRFQHGDAGALSEAAQHGLKLFRGRGNCTACHSGPLFSDQEFHNTGVSWAREPLDLGRFEVTQREPDRGRFKTPSLRDVALTAPYMHDGSLATLADVIDFYSKGANPNPNLDREIRPLNLTPEEKADLIAFLKALSGRP